jgi:hypothetical protein
METASRRAPRERGLARREHEFIECAAALHQLVPNEPLAARADVPAPARRRPTIQGGDGFGRLLNFGGSQIDSLIHGGRRFFSVHPGLAPIFGCAALLNFLRRNEPGSHATQDCADLFGSFAPWKIGVVHAQQHGASDGQEADKEW